MTPEQREEFRRDFNTWIREQARRADVSVETEHEPTGTEKASEAIRQARKRESR